MGMAWLLVGLQVFGASPIDEALLTSAEEAREVWMARVGLSLQGFVEFASFLRDSPLLLPPAVAAGARFRSQRESSPQSAAVSLCTAKSRQVQLPVEKNALRSSSSQPPAAGAKEKPKFSSSRHQRSPLSPSAVCG